MTARVPRSAVLLVLVSCCAVPLWGADLLVEEATLYVGAPAAIDAVVTPEGTAATFDLPKLLLTDSVRVTQGQAVVPVSLEPVFVPGQDPLKPELDRYHAEVARLTAGVPLAVQFRTSGFDWTPSMALDADGDQGRITVQASVRNNALDLGTARVRLMSGATGDVEHLPPDLRLDSEWLLRTVWRARADQEGGGLQLVGEVAGAEVQMGGTKQVPLLASPAVIGRSYRWETAASGRYGPAGPDRIHAVYAFTNTTDRALPEGRVSVKEDDAVVGSGYMVWTPPGEEAVVAVPSMQGASASRTEEQSSVPETWETRHSTRLRVESSRAEPFTLTIAEQRRDPWYDRYGEGRVYEFSAPPQSGEDGAFEWSLVVPAGGHASVSYHYAEPIDETPLRLISFIADDSPREGQYLVEAPATSVVMVRERPFRKLQQDGYALYRLPVPGDTERAELRVTLGNSFRVSIAPEVNGKPGQYGVAADAVAIHGRAVRDGSNWSWYTFDLTPHLSAESRAIYLLIDDPEGSGVFLGECEVLRVPEGFASRAPAYAVRHPAVAGVAAGKELASTRPSPEAAAPAPAPAPTTTWTPPAQRHVLLAFDVWTHQEEEATYYESGTHHHADGRAVQQEARLIYAFTIPAEIEKATCVVTAGDTFAILVARDENGRPGEWHEEIDILKLVGRKVRDMENRLEYTIDLTPYLEDNPTRTVYVAVRPATYHDAGAVVFRVEVAELDEVEEAAMEKRQHRLDLFVEEDRSRYLLLFETNGGAAEAPYLHGGEGHDKHIGPYSRGLEGREYVIYRLPIPEKALGSQIRALVDNTFIASMAFEQDGRPGEFREVARGGGKMGLDIISAMVAAGTVYLKFEYSRPDDPGGIVVKEISIRRP